MPPASLLLRAFCTRLLLSTASSQRQFAHNAQLYTQRQRPVAGSTRSHMRSHTHLHHKRWPEAVLPNAGLAGAVLRQCARVEKGDQARWEDQASSSTGRLQARIAAAAAAAVGGASMQRRVGATAPAIYAAAAWVAADAVCSTRRQCSGGQQCSLEVWCGLAASCTLRAAARQQLTLPQSA